MLSVVAHHGPIDPGELWTAWNWDPLILVGLVVAAVVYWTALDRQPPGRARSPWPARSFGAGLAVVAVALVSPLDAMSASLGSAHMVQHVLLTTIAAPLLVLGLPVRTLAGGLAMTARRRLGRWRATPSARLAARAAADPVLTAGLFVAALWIWHARGPYEAALGSDALHGVEHLTFLVTALASWAAIVHARRRQGRAGLGVLVLFVLSLQCGLLGVLLTFATEPRYPSYGTTTQVWGLTPLADQQLAGVIMWVPAGAVYLVAALLLLRAWINTPSRAWATAVTATH